MSQELKPGRRAEASRRRRNATLVLAKLVVMGGCFWLISQQIQAAAVSRLVNTVNFGWLLLTIIFIAIEIPLVGERWRLIIHSLGYRMSSADVQAANGFGQFAGQVLPNLAGDGARAMLLCAQGVSLAHGAWSVVLDRAVGVFMLFTVALSALLLPSGLSALGGYREPILVTLALTTFGGTLALLLSGLIGPRIERIPRLRFLGTALVETHTALLGPHSFKIFGLSLMVHTITILCCYVLARALGLALPLTDAAVLMACMTVVTLLPISIGGWGVREVAVVALLTANGASTEEAFVYSISFGLVVLLATIPGAIYWLFRRRVRAEAKSKQ